MSKQQPFLRSQYPDRERDQQRKAALAADEEFKRQGGLSDADALVQQIPGQFRVESWAPEGDHERTEQQRRI